MYEGTLPRQDERVYDRRYLLGAAAVEVGEEAFGREVRLEQAAVPFSHGKLRIEGVH